MERLGVRQGRASVGLTVRMSVGTSMVGSTAEVGLGGGEARRSNRRRAMFSRIIVTKARLRSAGMRSENRPG